MLANEELVCNERTRVNWHKLKYRKFTLNVRKNFLFIYFFSVTVVKQWNKLPRKLEESPSLEILKI